MIESNNMKLSFTNFDIIIIIIIIIINISLFRIGKRTNIYNRREMSKIAKNVFLNTCAKNK